jgi:hypothetical protein
MVKRDIFEDNCFSAEMRYQDPPITKRKYWPSHWVFGGLLLYVFCNTRARYFECVVFRCRHHNHNHNRISVMELGHLLTRSGLTCPEVSLKVCHDSFCQLGSSVSLPWVVCYKAVCLHVVSTFSCIPVICPIGVIFNSFAICVFVL